jgi:hypothetical protein
LNKAAPIVKHPDCIAKVENLDLSKFDKEKVYSCIDLCLSFKASSSFTLNYPTSLTANQGQTVNVYLKKKCPATNKRPTIQIRDTMTVFFIGIHLNIEQDAQGLLLIPAAGCALKYNHFLLAIFFSINNRRPI